MFKFFIGILLLAFASHVFASEQPSSYQQFKSQLASAQYQIVPYDLQVAAFSDFAKKQRTLYIPVGSSPTTNANGLITYPDGTVIEKHFLFDVSKSQGCAALDNDKLTVSVEASQHKCMVESRYLIKEAGRWQPSVYRWRADQLEPEQFSYGVNIAIRRGKASFNYRVPSVPECYQCHKGAIEGINQLMPIGPSMAYRLAAKAETKEFISSEPQQFDPARQYLDINCAHCHNRSGLAASSGLFLQLHEPVNGICKPVTATGVDFGARYDIVPGSPETSILIKRMQSLDPQWRMPEMGSAVVDAQGVALVANWIRELKGSCDE